MLLNLQNNLMSEIKGLEELTKELFLEIHELRQEEYRLVQSRTLKGKFYNLAGYFFSVYCVYKIVIVK